MERPSRDGLPEEARGYIGSLGGFGGPGGSFGGFGGSFGGSGGFGGFFGGSGGFLGGFTFFPVCLLPVLLGIIFFSDAFSQDTPKGVRCPMAGAWVAPDEGMTTADALADYFGGRVRNDANEIKRGADSLSFIL